MEADASSKGKAPQPKDNKIKKEKLFGTKSKNAKSKKQKKSGVKVPSLPKAEDFCQGCITLASILSFQDDMIFLELPGNARGTLQLTEINDPFLQRLQHAIKNDEELPELENFFNIGDFLMATVISAGTHPVELSIRPNLVNSMIEPEEGRIFWGAVKSKEDRGYIIDLGKENVTAFLPFPAQLEVGQPAFVTLLKKTSESIYKCELTKKDFFPSVPTVKPFFDTLRPIDVLDGLVTSNFTNGALAINAQSFNGFCSKYSWPPGLTNGNNVQVRPVLIDHAQKTIWFTAIPRIVNGERPYCLDAKIGSKVTSKVSRIRYNVGIEFTMPDNENLRVFIPEKETKSHALMAGQDHVVRITERRPIDDLLLAADDPEIIDLAVFSADDVHPGQILDATISAINDKIGIFVKLSPFLTALCPVSYCDNDPEPKKGDVKKCVVLSVSEGHVRVAMKEKFVTSELPRVESLEIAHNLCESKEWTHALVRKSGKSALIVEFINGLVGMIRSSSLPVSQGQDISKQYPQGYVIKTMISSVDGDKINCVVSTDESQILTLGQTCTVTVDRFTEDAVYVRVPAKYGEINSVIQATHFSDYEPLSRLIFKNLNIGDKLRHACLIRNPGTNAPAYFTMKRCIRENTESIPKDTKSIKAGEHYFGFVSGIQNYGSFVSFFGRASGLIHSRQLTLGDSVNAFVDQVTEDGHIRLTTPIADGESIKFLDSFLKDAKKLNDKYLIDQEIQVQGDGEKSDEYFSYQLDEDWICLTNEKVKAGTTLKIAYADVLSKSVFAVLPPKKPRSIENNVVVKATVIGVFEPIFICTVNGRIVICPMVNYNNKTEKKIAVGEELEITVVDSRSESDETFEVLKGYPQYLLKSEISQNVVATITSVNDISCNAKLNDGRTVRIHRSQLSQVPEVGQQVKGSLMNGDNATFLITNPDSPQKIEDFKVGQQVTGVITKVSNDSLRLSMSPFVLGTVSSLQLSSTNRKVVDKPLAESYSVGDLFEGWVSSVSEKMITVTGIDPSFSSNVEFAKVLKIKTGDYATVKVGNGSLKKLDVTDVIDEYQFNPLSRLKKGKVIDVVNVSEENVSMKLSDITGTPKEIKIEEGEILQGYVCHAIKGALLVRLARNVTGRLPFGSIADCFIQDAAALYPLGTVVTVKIMKKTDSEITLSSKRSDITGVALTIQDLKVGDVVGGFITAANKNGVFVRLNDYQNKSGLVHHSMLNGKDPLSFVNLVNTRVDVEVLQVDLEKERISLKFNEIHSQNQPQEQEQQQEMETESDEGAEPEEVEIDLDEWSGDEEKVDEEEKEKEIRRKQTEEDIQRLEAKQIDPSAPKSDKEFTAALVANPHSSKLWISYMEFVYAGGDSKRAMEIGEQGLDKLPIGEKTEKSNIFQALITLIVLSAEPKHFMEECIPIVERAAQTIDEEVMWLRFAKTVHQNRKDFSQEAWKVALRKVKQNVTMWSSYLNSLLQDKKVDFAKDELKRCLGGTFQGLAKESVEVRKQFGISEYENEYTEHGRTMFENLINEFPTKYQLWNAYVDAECKYGEHLKARNIFERMTTLDLKIDRMKQTLKKWRAFEEKNGNDPAIRKKINKIASEFSKRVIQAGN